MSETRTLFCLLAVLLGGCASGTPARPGSSDAATRTASLASLRVGELTGTGDYLLSTHPNHASSLVVNQELRVAPGGPILELVLRTEVRVTERGSASPVGFEVIRPDASDKVLLRFEPPGGSDARTFVVNGTGARELVIRPTAASRDLVAILGSSRVTWAVEAPDSGRKAPS